MKIIDVHSHWGTRRGYPLQTRRAGTAAGHLELGGELSHRSRDGAYFRDSGVRAILDFGFSKFLPLEEMRALHDYAFETEAAHRDVILGHWVHIDPQRAGAAGVKELRRCIDKRIGFLGFAVSARSPPASDPLYAALLRALHRGRHSRADLRRHDRARRRLARRRRRHSRRLSSAPSRSRGRDTIPS